MAQSTQDVVYLKNGSIIKGEITGQIPGKSLVIKTADGSTFVYKVDEVEKIEKEKVAKQKSLREKYMDEAKSDMKNAVLTEGYKAFFSIDYSFNTGDFKKMINFGLSTTHGYQINPYIFAGVGVGINMWGEAGSGHADFGVPVFGNVRITPLKYFITPVLEARLGNSFGKVKGLYFNPQAGIRIGIRNRSAAGVMVGYQLQEMDGITDTMIDPNTFDVYVKRGKVKCHGVALRCYWEF